MSREITVDFLKAGGSSVGSPPALDQMTSAVYKHQQMGHGVVLVVSAIQGVTDNYREALKQARLRRSFEAETNAAYNDQAFLIRRTIHSEEVESNIVATLNRESVEAERWLNVAADLGQTGDPKVRAIIEDKVLPPGEPVAAHLVASKLRQTHIDAVYLDSRNFLVTDSNHGDANPDMAATRAKLERQVLPNLLEGKVVVVPGFVGMDTEGNQTTFGKGGSDRTVTVLAQAMKGLVKVGGVYLYKGDPGLYGIMNADPRIVRDASVVEHANYGVIEALANIGGSVLHPKALRHAREEGFDVHCRSTLNLEHPGTLIDGTDRKNDWPVVAVTALEGLQSVKISGKGMDADGLTEGIFAELRKLGINTRFISSPLSEQMAIAFQGRQITQDEARAALEYFISKGFIDNVDYSGNTSAVGIIGPRVGSPSTMVRLYKGLESVKNLRPIIERAPVSKGMYDYSILLENSEREDTRRAVRAIHHSLFS